MSDKIKVKVANIGQNIIDYCGYIYTVQDVFDKYVSIGNGEFIMHQDYKILPDHVQKEDVEYHLKLIEDSYKKFGLEFASELDCMISSRFSYINENEEDPRHIYTFEEFSDQKGDNDYEYEFQEIGQASS
jgi:hypothetical protein